MLRFAHYFLCHEELVLFKIGILIFYLLRSLPAAIAIKKKSPNLGLLLLFFLRLGLAIHLVQTLQKFTGNIHCAVLIKDKTRFIRYNDRISFILIIFRTKFPDHRKNFLLRLHIITFVI